MEETESINSQNIIKIKLHASLVSSIKYLENKSFYYFIKSSK